MRVTEETWTEISRHAQDAFPDECCGVIVADGRSDYAHRLKNMQNTLHALDPQTYPRTAEIAYAMDPLELEAVIQQ
ncbi:MAG TPA: Mov34/MPN/PAD-1 family protein, partial [Candidatus Binatia bacterium]